MTTRLFRLALAATLCLSAAPALAQTAAASAPRSESRVTVPTQLNASQRENYRAVFAAIEAQDWTGAAARLDGMPVGPLHDLARAMLYTAPNSPLVEVGPLIELLARAPELPQATDLARLATARGATMLPVIPSQQRLFGLAGQPRRSRPRPVRGDPVADALEPLIQPLIVEDRPRDAETLLQQRAYELSPEARTAFQQRIAWSYYLNGGDGDALRLANEARQGVTEWAIAAEWVAGLAAWRLGDCNQAATFFDRVGTRSGDQELLAAGQYWAARADMRCRRPERVQARLRTAARLDETFYGLLSKSALGMRQVPVGNQSFTAAEWQALSNLRNVRAAIALDEIGETRLAGDLLRHQARLGTPAQHSALLHLAARLQLTSTQMWLAHNAPRGARVDVRDRYPDPDWRPQRGWRVDEALAFAVALQESGFRPEAGSAAGARGLMQVRPGTAGDLVRWRGITADPNRLTDPATNLEFGQAYLEHLRDGTGTGGLLPKVIASYNAGPAPIQEWNYRYDQSDPLLFMETIPYWETRGYVPIVLRNYWIYEQKPADSSASRRALVQGLWPRFPGLPGPTAVRLPPRAPQPFVPPTTASPPVQSGAPLTR